MTEQEKLEQTCVNTIRCLAMDAVQAANAGHPGTPMAMAPVAYTLWNRHLRFDPDDPIWPNRDRFVLSMGHASLLLYAMLHLSGVRAVNRKYESVGELSVKADDIRRFRQLDSRCPGHPEYRWTSGIEATTGPLGQGYATSVGMAIAGKWMAAHFNRPGFEMFDYNVYALGGDGCMMEGASSEAASLAGHLKLDNLCWIYDNNKITIEGRTSLAFSEDVATRFMAYGWNVTRVGDANDLEMLDRAFAVFRRTNDRPTLVIVDSHIGWGAPTKQDTEKAHGEPLGEDEVRGAKRNYGFPEDEQFYVPDEVFECFRQGIGSRGPAHRNEWMDLFDDYAVSHPKEADHLYRMQHRELPGGWDAPIPAFPADMQGIAGHEASAKVLNAIAKEIPWLMGGSADVSPEAKTRLTFDRAGDFGPPELPLRRLEGSGIHVSDRFSYAGRNIHFGVRELAMGSILNGLALSKVRPFGSGFLVFSDFSRPSMRLAAMMEIPVIYIFTHDSIGVGEDGPTHQPIEHLAALRALPGLITLRPADANEIAEAWRLVMQLRHQPVAMVLTDQNVPTLDREKYASAAGVARGGYVLADAEGRPDAILMASGSEVPLCIDAYERLRAEGIKVRVVSLPSWELFEEQDEAYRNSVIPPDVTARVSVELGSTFGWDRLVGTGTAIGFRTLGAHAPLMQLRKKFGFNTDTVVAAVKDQIARHKAQAAMGEVSMGVPVGTA